MKPSSFLLVAALLSCTAPQKEAQEPALNSSPTNTAQPEQRETSAQGDKKKESAKSNEESALAKSPQSDPLGGGNDQGDGFGSGSGAVTVSIIEVVGGKAEIKGGLDQDIVRRVIRRAMNQIKFCYEQGLQTNPSLGGKMKVYFVVSPNGSVSEASIKQGLSKEVDECVSRKISQLTFPAPTGGEKAEVVYPLTFQSAQP